MKIENTLLNNLLQINKIDLLKEGTIFRGRIVEIKDETISINIPEVGQLEASLDIKYEFAAGDNAVFVVKSIDKNKIYLKPLEVTHLNQSMYENNNPVDKLLKEIGIEKNHLTIGLLENLMANNLPINRDIVNEGIKILEKLIKILDVKDGENVDLSDPNLLRQSTLADIDTLDIRHLIFIDKSLENALSSNLDENLDKIDINLDNKIANDISDKIKDYIKNDLQLVNDQSLIKITSFLLKNNLKPTLRNIKYINKLDTSPEEFFREIQEIFYLDKKDVTYKIDTKPSEEYENPTGLKFISTKEENLDKLNKIIVELGKEGKKDLEKIEELENKIDFLRELNKDINFMFFPLDFGAKERLEGLMTFIKERKKRGLGEKINILINLNTENLGNIRIYCTLIGDNLGIKMSVREEDLEFFKSTEEKLIEKILTIGYSLKGIEYIIDEKISIIDSNVIKPSSSYVLDLKV